MLLTLLAWIYITFLCWAWGTLMLQWMKTFFKDDSFIFPHFSIICVAGMTAITVFAGILSLVMPLGGWQAQLIIISPCFFLFFKKQKLNFPAQLKKQLTGLHPFILFLLTASLLMVLLMSTWKINHPDTLGYHAQTIQWIEKYKVIPGLVHLHTRYGYQGQWFVSCAFFSFRFTGTEALTFINSTVITWYLFFIIGKINEYFFTPGKTMHGFLWLLLFAASCLSYTQLRLTASSASPDFIATLFIWVVFYLSQEKISQSAVHWSMIIILSVFSITLKLFAVPVFILAVYAGIRLFRLKKIKPLLISCALAVLVVFPFLARNIVTTGYLVFPSVFPDIVNVDWKFDKDLTKLEKNYITAYARTHVSYAKEEIETTMAMSPGKWLPQWWQNTPAADKIILLLLALSFIAAIIRLNVILRTSLRTKTALLAALAGIVFWFIQAPDPRFGFGFIIAFITMTLVLFFDHVKSTGSISKKMITIPVLLAALAVSAYTGYRVLNFFSSRQLVKPIGIEMNSSASFQCQQVLFHKPTDSEFCGDLPVPCIYTDSCNFILRGDKISDGFRAK